MTPRWRRALDRGWKAIRTDAKAMSTGTAALNTPPGGAEQQDGTEQPAQQ